jgi:hypothetical protein
MDYTKVLRRAWHIMKNYRALWIFGIILALTTVSWGAALWFGNGGEDSDRVLIDWELSAKDQQWLERNLGIHLPRTFALTRADLKEKGIFVLEDDLPERVARALPTIAKVLVTVTIVLLIAFPIARYVAEAALMRMVDEYEETEKAHSVGEGLRLGWSIAAWRLFWIDVVVFTMLFAVTCLVFVPALVPVLLVIDSQASAILIGSTVALGLAFLGAALVVIAWTAGTLWVRLARRACALNGLGVIESLRQSYSTLRRQAKEVAPIWLAMVGVELTYPFLITPVAIVLLGVGVVVGGLVTLLVDILARQVMALTTAWVVAAALGVTIFVLTLTVPLAVLGGLREVFQSSIWTVAYRELRALEGLQRTPAAELDGAGLKPVPSA